MSAFIFVSADLWNARIRHTDPVTRHAPDDDQTTGVQLLLDREHPNVLVYSFDTSTAFSMKRGFLKKSGSTKQYKLLAQEQDDSVRKE
jgi:hypothetical protein